jgi:predicted RNA-binding protein with PUA-like domain
MNFWLVKSDPDTYGWPEMVADKKTFWSGVRNYAARNNMKAMKKGDLVLFYHSQSDKAIVGLVEVAKEAYQDPTTEDTAWVVVDLKVSKPLKRPVTLAEIKATPALANIGLIKLSRLSVMPVSKEEFELILKMSEV